MKKLAFLAVAVFSFSAVCANDPVKVETLSAKVILENTNGYFVLSDGSFYKVIGFSTRWRSLSEWWNNVQLVPKSYECVPNDWFIGTQIEAYSKYENINVNEEDASNQDALKQCTHLLMNKRTGQVLFAIALEPADCMVQLFNEAKKDGYDKGLTDGRLKNNQSSDESFKSGHAAGYKTGFAEGFEAALKRIDF